MTREELRELIKKDPEKVIDLIFLLFDKIEELTQRINDLENQLIYAALCLSALSQHHFFYSLPMKKILNKSGAGCPGLSIFS